MFVLGQAHIALAEDEPNIWMEVDAEDDFGLDDSTTNLLLHFDYCLNKSSDDAADFRYQGLLVFLLYNFK